MLEPARIPELEQRVISARNGLRLGTPCYAYHEVASTMDLAHQIGQEGAPEGACVWAETQTGGRGRAGRTWASPPGGIYLSVILRPQRPTREVPQLALVAGLALAQTIQEVTNVWSSIRWPNDVLLNGQKLAGILVEAKSDHASKPYAAIGLGLNVTTTRDGLPAGATALAHWVNPIIDRFALAGTFFRCLDQSYQQWNRDGFAPIRAQLTRWMGVFGHMVHITTAKDEFQGQAMDLDEEGRLTVRLDSGVVRTIDMGDVALLQ